TRTQQSRQRRLGWQMRERRQLRNREQVAAPAEYTQRELALRAEDAAAAEADPALIGGDGAGERVNPPARSIAIGGGDAEPDEAAVERIGGLLEHGAHIRTHRRIERLPLRCRAWQDELEQAQRARGGNAGANPSRRRTQPPLLARGRRSHDHLHQRLFFVAEVCELSEDEPQRVRSFVGAEWKPLRPRQHELARNARRRAGLARRHQVATSSAVPTTASVRALSSAGGVLVVMPGQAEASARSTS